MLYNVAVTRDAVKIVQETLTWGASLFVGVDLDRQGSLVQLVTVTYEHVQRR